MAEPVAGKLDPSRATFITIVGKKGSGKSVLARRLWDTWPHDALVIDPNGDIDLPDVEKLSDPLPTHFPGSLDDQPVKRRYVPDPGSPTHLDDMDRAVGLAYFHPRTEPVLLWLDEVGVQTTAHKTEPHMRRALHQGRHRRLSMLMCGPRPIDINPLVMSQADFVYIFELPNPRDRQRVADCIGWNPAELDTAIVGLAKYEYLRYDANTDDPELELIQFPPIPLAQKPAKAGR